MRVFLEFKLQTQEWGEVKLSRVVPYQDDPWGKLAPLKETPWGQGIPVVSGENFSHAMHGHAMPLMRSLGPPPKVRLKRISEAWRHCEMAKGCISHQQQKCHPCQELPDCYCPPLLKGDLQQLALHIALAWRDGFYVLVVDGPEFSY